MIQWKTVEADVVPRDLAAVLESFPFVTLISVTATLSRGPLILLSENARKSVFQHVSAHREECGGLLLGVAVTPGRLGAIIPNPIVCVMDAVPARNFRGTAVSLKMDASVWTSAMEGRSDGVMVVGWFHSHPSLGAFFSGTDRRTQRSVFVHEYSLGYVIDPVRDEHAYFVGPDSQEVAGENVVTYRFDSDLPSRLRC